MILPILMLLFVIVALSFAFQAPAERVLNANAEKNQNLWIEICVLSN